MNWLLILVIIWIAGSIAWGMYRGFLRVVYTVAAWVFLMAAVTWATPYAAKLLTEQTAIDERIEEGLSERLHALVRGEAEAAVDGEGLKLPAAIADRLSGTGKMADQLLDETGVYAMAAQEAGRLAMRGIAFALVFLVSLVVFYIFSAVLKLVSGLPVIGEVNRLLGAAAGLVKGMLLVWLVFAVTAMGSCTAAGASLTGTIYESEILIWLYENNPVLSILMIFL